MRRYKLQTYQFGIVSGIRQEVSDRISSALPGNLFAPEARKGQLFVLTEAVNDNVRGKEACDLVANVIMAAYYKDSSFSITSSLRKSLITANTTLYEHNFKAAHHQKTAVSLTCAVLRGNDLYIAQVQPTQAYIAHKGKLRALPTYPSWDPTTSSSAMLRPNALGTSLFSEPELYRNVIEPGDEVVLCSSRLARVLGRNEAERLFCLEDAPSALEELYIICRRNALSEAHIALIELLPMVSAAAQDAPLSPEGISERGKAAATVVGDWITQVTGNVALFVRPPATPEAADADQHGALDESQLHPTSAIVEQPSLPSSLEGVDPQDMSWLRGRPRYRPRNTSDQDAWPPSAYLGEGSLMPALNATMSRTSIDLSDHSPLPVDFAAIPQRDPLPPASWGYKLTLPARILIAVLSTFFANVGRRRRPGATPLPRFEQGRGLSYRRKGRPFPWTALLLLVGLLGFSYIYLTYRTQQDNTRQSDEALTKAATTLSAAQQEPDDQAALALLDTLDDTLKALSTDDTLATDLRRKERYAQIVGEAEQLRASITHTSLLSDLKVVATLPLSDTISRMLAIPTSPQPTLYYLASQSGIVYQQPEQAAVTPTVVLSPSTEIESFIGPFIAGEIRSIVWRDVGPDSSLAAIDNSQFSASTLYLGPPPRWFTNRLDGSELWAEQPFPDIESFGGNLYVWEWGPSASGQIKKYASGEYSSLPTDWITSQPPDLNLQTAIDMAIDGRIYLLQPNGEVVIFHNSIYERTLAAPEIEPKLTGARKLFITLEQSAQSAENQGHIFVLDPLNERIIEIDLQGNLIQQMRVPDQSSIRLSQLTDLAVISEGGQRRRLYLANGNQILSTPIPDPPAPRKIVPATRPLTTSTPGPTQTR